MNWNHNRSVEDFRKQISILRKHGYNPIAVSQMICEDVFVFETPEEAQRAAQELEFNDDESKNKLQAWWYGRDEFLITVQEYEEQWPDCKVLIHWL
jgi:hypothetical protein